MAENNLFYRDLANKLNCTHKQETEEPAIVLITTLNTTPNYKKITINNPIEGNINFTLPLKLQEISRIIETIEQNGFLVADCFCDIQNRQLCYITGQKNTPLTQLESQILQHLYDNPQGVTKQQLQAAVWQYDAEADTRTVETHLSRLGQKFRYLEYANNNYKIQPTL